MSRAAMGDTVVVKPSNNIYTALAGLTVVALAVGLVLFFLKAKVLIEGFPKFM